MSKITLNMSEGSLDLTTGDRVSRLYKRVFATPPWNEAYLCTDEQCKQNYSLDQVNESLLCEKCGAPLREFYEQALLTREIMEISERTGFRLATLLSGGELSGFWFGWDGNLEEINRQKLSLSDDDLTMVMRKLETDPDRRWFYLAEFGMEPELRNRGLGKELFRYGLDQTKAKSIIARTTPSSPAYFINGQNGFRTVWEYSDGTGRVVMAQISPDQKS